MSSPQTSRWMSFLEDNLLGEEVQPSNAFFWCSTPVPNPACFGVDNDGSRGDSDDQNTIYSGKRSREESCGGVGSKACREKLRRDRLNDRFTELSSILEPSKPPKTDKAAILSDAVKVLNQLRTEVQQLKDSNNELQEAIKAMKAEKNELRDQKLKLKAEKERLDNQIKLISLSAGYLPHPAAMQAMATFTTQNQAASDKTASPGMTMWQWMSPMSVDTSQDHVLRPPVA